MYKKHIINKAMKILFLAMLTSQLHASCAYAEEKTSTDQNIGIEADLIAEDTELVEVSVLLKERATADDTVPAAKDAESDSAEEQAPAAVPEIVAEDAESDSSEDQIPAAVPELAAEDTKAALSVEDQIPNIDDLGPAGEDTSQSTKNVSDSQEAPEFKLYWGPLWDFDMGFAFDVNEEELDPTSAEGYYTIGFPWIDHLRESDPYFVKLLKDRWGELQPKLEALTADGGIIDQFKTEIAGAQADDYRKWSYAAGYNPYYKGVSDYDAVIDRLKQLIDARVIWFSENLETVGSFLTVSMDAAGGTGVMADIITVKKDGEFELPVCEFTPENGSEFVGWKIGDKLYGEGDVVTLSKDTVIMAVWKVTAPDDEPVDEPTEIVTPVPDKPAAVEFVAYETKPDKKTEDDPSDTVANAGRSEERKAEVTAGNGKYRSPDSGDEPETLLWLLILVVAGIAGGLRAVSIMKPNPGAVTPLGLR